MCKLACPIPIPVRLAEVYYAFYCCLFAPSVHTSTDTFCLRRSLIRCGFSHLWLRCVPFCRASRQAKPMARSFCVCYTLYFGVCMRRSIASSCACSCSMLARQPPFSDFWRGRNWQLGTGKTLPDCAVSVNNVTVRTVHVHICGKRAF